MFSMNIFEIMLPTLIHILLKSVCHGSHLYSLKTKKQLVAVAGQGIVLLCETVNVCNPCYKGCIGPVIWLVGQEVSFDL